MCGESSRDPPAKNDGTGRGDEFVHEASLEIMTRSKPGAVERNKNASSHGLYSQKPWLKVAVAPDAGLDVMAGYANDLASAALWIAESLAEVDGLSLKDQKLIGLYATVAQELNQLAAELLGEVGIKPAPLGNLPDAQYEVLMEKHAQALSLQLSQCMSTWNYLKDREEIRTEVENADQTTPVLGKPDGLVRETDGVKTVNTALEYLAAHLRGAKRMMREMAANFIWKHRGSQSEEDLSARLLKVIEK